MPNIKEESRIRRISRTAVKLGVGAAVLFGSSSPAAATVETSDAPTNRASIGIVNPENHILTIKTDNAPAVRTDIGRIPEPPLLGQLIGAAVIAPTDLRQIQPASLNLSNGPIFFHAKYNEATSNPENNWAGVWQHQGMSVSNVDYGAVDVYPTGVVGEVVFRGRNGGRVAYSFYQEQRNQWQGGLPYPIESQPPNMTYYFEGLRPGQPVSLADPDTGQELKWDQNTPVVYLADAYGNLALEVPHTIYGAVKVQVVFAEYSGQIVIIRHRYNNSGIPGLSLPNGVVRPEVPGAY